MAKPNAFVWYELMTTDAPAATAFYRDVVGWGAHDSGHPDKAYTLLTVGEAPVAGLVALPQEACAAGARPGWIGYIGVEDVDAFTARVTEAGGALLREAEDLAVGRFAVVADPQGAAFILFTPSAGEGGSPAIGTPGHAGWRELHAAEWQGAFAFYAGLFGWTKAEAVDMGPMGTYQLFAAGAEPLGGMMTKADAVPAPFWLYYFNVDEIAAAVERVKRKGGQVINGPHEVPGPMWVVQCLDPQGAMFALVGPRL